MDLFTPQHKIAPEVIEQLTNTGTPHTRVSRVVNPLSRRGYFTVEEVNTVSDSELLRRCDDFGVLALASWRAAFGPGPEDPPPEGRHRLWTEEIVAGLAERRRNGETINELAKSVNRSREWIYFLLRRNGYTPSGQLNPSQVT